MNRIAYILSVCIFLTQVSILPSLASTEKAIWTQLCASGQWIKIDLGSENENPPTRPKHAKICHAVCCSNKDDGDSHDESNGD